MSTTTLTDDEFAQALRQVVTERQSAYLSEGERRWAAEAAAFAD